MTIATCADLKAAAANWLNRSNLSARIPEFITLAEARIAYGSTEQPFASEPLRIRAMETSASLTVNAQTVALPTGFLQQRRLYIAASPNIEVNYITPHLFWNNWISSTFGPPSEYTVEGENLVFGPTPDVSYSGRMLYYKKFDPLVGDADTNWLLTNAPGVYLQGVLFEAYKFARNMEQAQAALNSFSGSISGLMNANKADRYSGPWVARSDTATP